MPPEIIKIVQIFYLLLGAVAVSLSGIYFAYSFDKFLSKHLKSDHVIIIVVLVIIIPYVCLSSSTLLYLLNKVLQ